MTTMPATLRIRGVGKPVPKLGAGCWPIGGPAFHNGMPIGWDHPDPDRAYAGLVRAYELGVRMFDTADAIETMRMFQKDGLVSAIGMSAPREFALQWARTDGPRSTQAQRFLYLFAKIRPEVLAVRHNVLSHQYRPNETDIFAFAREHGVGVLVNEPLGRGTLLRTHQRSPRAFSAGDHRNADPMFRPEILQAIDEGLRVVTDRFGGAVSDLARVALRCAMQVDPGAVVLVGFRDEDQMTRLSHDAG